MDATDDTLRQQFQALQEQQQKKLLRRKQRQEEKNKKELVAKEREENGKKTKDGSEPGGLRLDDDLDLKLSEPVINDIKFDEELTAHLNGQIRELKDESGRLYKLLSERDYEIRKLKKQRDEDRLALGGGGFASDTAATKIVDLSKKNRELTAELEGEKTKVKQLLRKVRDKEKEVREALQQSQPGEIGGKSTHQKTPLSEEQSIDQAASMAAELKTLQDSLNKSQAKQTDFRNQVNLLKQELKVAHKVLSKELGENVNIQNLLNDSSNWRGRAQQIILLQNKVSELNQQIDQFKSRPGTEMSLEEQFMTMEFSEGRSSITSAPPRSTKGVGRMDERQRQRLRQQEKDKREEKEKATIELKTLEEDYRKLKEKLDASKARNKVLSNEVKALKQQNSTLLDKGKHDNELIEALLGQQDQLKKHLDLSTKQHQDAKKLQEHAGKQLQLRSQQEANTVDQLRLIVKEKEATVQRLEDEVLEMRRMQEQQLQRLQHNGFTDTPPDRPQSRTPSRSFTITSMDRPLSAERHSGLSHGSPTPPQSRQGIRPPTVQRGSSRLSNGDTPSRASSRGTRPTSAGSVTSASGEGSEDWRRQLQQYRSLCQVAEVERDKLMELVQILQNRADDANIKTTEAQSSLQEVKQRNVWLEKQLGKVKVESSSGKGVKKSSTVKSTTTMTSGGYVTDEELVNRELSLNHQTLDELQTRLGIQMDENNALKSAVKSTLKAKEEDLKLYHEMMRQTKEVFLQGLRQFKQSNAISS
ncbi:coiled-coil domain-containing protein 13-like [Asterias amurensis]|uniref:coiled-coil domain-containing protein 13-like n=1 Tax=Asterias amurensis TaxID=7602 RepID=UPI003AB49CB0